MSGQFISAIGYFSAKVPVTKGQEAGLVIYLNACEIEAFTSISAEEVVRKCRIPLETPTKDGTLETALKAFIDQHGHTYVNVLLKSKTTVYLRATVEEMLHALHYLAKWPGTIEVQLDDLPAMDVQMIRLPGK